MFTVKKLSRLKCVFFLLARSCFPVACFLCKQCAWKQHKTALCLVLRFGMFAPVLLICQFFVCVFVSYLSVIFFVISNRAQKDVDIQRR